MFKLSPRSRGSRVNKGFKVKHALQLILLLCIGIWLRYQIQRSYSKEKTYGDGNEVSGKLQDEKIRFGRKDIPDPILESSNIDGEKKVEVKDVKRGEDEDERGKMEGTMGEKLVKEANYESMEEQNEEGKEEEGLSREGEGEGWESEEKENEEMKEEEVKDGGENESDEEKQGEKIEKGKETKEDNNEVIKGNEEYKDDEKVKEESGENENKEESKEGGNEEGKGSSGSHVEEKKENKEEAKEESKVSDGSQGEGQEKESKVDNSDKSDENQAENTNLKVENLGSSNELVQNGNNKSDRATIENHKKENSSFTSDNNEESLENRTLSLQEKPESDDSHSLITGTTGSSEDKQANVTTFSDETFASQNDASNTKSAKEGDPNIQEITEKPEKRETGFSDNQLDTNYDASLKTEETSSGESGGSLTDGNTSYADTSGHEGANGENPEKILDSLSRTNETIFQSYTTSTSGKQKVESLNSKENSNVDPHENPNVGPHKQGDTSNGSEARKEDLGNVEHRNEAENVTLEVKDRTELDTLPHIENDGSSNRDAIAK